MDINFKENSSTMKNSESPWVPQPSTRDYLYTLYTFPNYLKLLNSKEKPYYNLLKWIIEKQTFLDDDSYSLPTLGFIAKELNIGSSKLSLYLKNIYNDILDLNWHQPELFKKGGQVPCLLMFKHWGHYESFNFGLDIIPRIGEHFHFDFVKPKLDCSYFHVDDINYEITSKGQRVTISMSSGSSNTYLKLLKDKAYLKREISMHEYYNFEIDYELRDKLVKLYSNL